MKGVSPLLSHSLFFIIGIGVSVLILTTISTLKSDLEERTFNSELNSIADFTKNEILSLYSLSTQVDSNKNITMGNIKLSLPEKIGSHRYTVDLYQNGVGVRLFLRNKTLQMNRTVNISAIMTGSSNIPAYLKLDLFENGTRLISLV